MKSDGSMMVRRSERNNFEKKKNFINWNIIWFGKG